MNMKKKMISLLLALALVVGICPAAFAAETKACNNLKYLLRAAYIPNVGSDSSNLKNDSIDMGRHNVQISDFSATQANAGGDITFSGTLNGLPFNVCAVPYDSPANKNVQVFDATDTLGNYDVIYSDIEQNIQDSAIYFNRIFLDNYANVLKLYLRPVDSVDFVVVELFAHENYAQDYLAKPVSEDADAPGRVSQLWYTKIFNAPLVEETNPDIPMPLYIKDWASTIEYSQNFSHLGYDWKQRFSVTLYVSYPTSFSNTETYATGYRVTNSCTECITKPNESTSTSNITLRNARVDIACGAGTAVHGYQMTGLTQKAASASVKINFNTTVKINTVLSVTLNYKNSYWRSLNASAETFEGTSDYVREFGFDLGTDKLVKVNDYVNADWEIKNYGGKNANVPFKVTFSYMMINELNASAWSGQTQTKDVTVYSNTTA